MLYDTERSTKAPNEATYETLNRRISSNAAYSLEILKTCIHSLGISESNVLQATRDEATRKYIDFIVDIAERYDWVVALLAIVPCIQVSTSTCPPTNHSNDENQMP
jgi:thiaminase